MGEKSNQKKWWKKTAITQRKENFVFLWNLGSGLFCSKQKTKRYNISDTGSQNTTKIESLKMRFYLIIEYSFTGLFV